MATVAYIHRLRAVILAGRQGYDPRGQTKVGPVPPFCWRETIHIRDADPLASNLPEIRPNAFLAPALQACPKAVPLRCIST